MAGRRVEGINAYSLRIREYSLSPARVHPRWTDAGYWRGVVVLMSGKGWWKYAGRKERDGERGTDHE